MRFFTLLFLCLLVFSNCSPSDKPPTKEQPAKIKWPDRIPLQRTWNVALLMEDGVFNTELTAPMDIFHHSKFRSDTALNVFTIAKTTAPIVSFEGLTIVPDFGFNDSFPPIDILVIPSAENHMGSSLEDTVLLQFVQKTAANAGYITSHCDGALVLAEDGLLQGVECTTFPGDLAAFRESYPELTTHANIDFVHDGKYITSAGGARSFEAALYLHQLLFGLEATKETAEGMVIDWQPADVPCVIVR